MIMSVRHFEVWLCMQLNVCTAGSTTDSKILKSRGQSHRDENVLSVLLCSAVLTAK